MRIYRSRIGPQTRSNETYDAFIREKDAVRSVYLHRFFEIEPHNIYLPIHIFMYSNYLPLNWVYKLCSYEYFLKIIAKMGK